MKHLIIYGGTFDPIHLGHLGTAINVQNYFHFDRFVFLPCKIPVLKDTLVANADQRIQMLNLALATIKKPNHFIIDDSEIERETPSYTVETLRHYRKLYGKKIALTILMGEDVFAQLHEWYHWEELLQLGNILLIQRAGFREEHFSDILQNLLRKHQSKEKTILLEKAQGVIYTFDAGSFPISSTKIRQAIKAGRDLKNFLPITVINYITANNLYQ